MGRCLACPVFCGPAWLGAAGLCDCNGEIQEEEEQSEEEERRREMVPVLLCFKRLVSRE